MLPRSHAEVTIVLAVVVLWFVLPAVFFYTSALSCIEAPASRSMSAIYPTYEAVQTARGNAPGGLQSIDLYRLRWFIKKDTSLHDSITVIEDVFDSQSAQESYSASHPISRAALTDPPVSAITVSVDTLDNYSPEWDYWHSEHAAPERNHGELFDAEGELEHCCGQELPGPGPTLDIVAKPGAFVTIGQLIETVHPWLQKLDSQLRWALNIHGGEPLDSAVDFFVRPGRLTPLSVQKARGCKPENWADDWAQAARGARNVQRIREQART